MLRRFLRVLVRRKALLSLLFVGAAAGVVYGQTREQGFDLSYVAITGSVNEAQRAEVYRYLLACRDHLHGIGDIKQALDEVPWIEHVDVLRRWPNHITVTVYEEQPIAWWNGDEFLDDEGHVFTSPWISGPGLAHLSGPVGTEREVMEQYQQLARALGRTGRSIRSLVLDARGAWEFTTSGGIHVMLGKDDIMDRFQRFLQVLGSASLAERIADIKQIDTRYGNGVAVSWKEVPSGLSVAKTDNY